jgi:hypothetical protein
MVYRFASDGTLIAGLNVGLNIAGLAYNPDSQHLFVMTNGETNHIYVLDVTNGYNLLGRFAVPGFDAYAGAGLEIDCEGKLWAVQQNTQAVFRIDSGESASFCAAAPAQVSWLTMDPGSGTLVPGAQAQVTVGLNATGAAVSQPGVYRALIRISDDSPYPAQSVPVTMTVTAGGALLNYLPFTVR